MVTLTYIDAYQVERTTTYPDLAAQILFQIQLLRESFY